MTHIDAKTYRYVDALDDAQTCTTMLGYLVFSSQGRCGTTTPPVGPPYVLVHRALTATGATAAFIEARDGAR